MFGENKTEALVISKRLKFPQDDRTDLQKYMHKMCFQRGNRRGVLFELQPFNILYFILWVYISLISFNTLWHNFERNKSGAPNDL